MGRRWRRRVRRAAPGAARGRETDAEGRCPGGEDAEPVVVDLIDLARPPLKLVPLENLLPPVTAPEREPGVRDASRRSADAPRSAE